MNRTSVEPSPRGYFAAGVSSPPAQEQPRAGQQVVEAAITRADLEQGLPSRYGHLNHVMLRFASWD